MSNICVMGKQLTIKCKLLLLCVVVSVCLWLGVPTPLSSSFLLCWLPCLSVIYLVFHLDIVLVQTGHYMAITLSN